MSKCVKRRKRSCGDQVGTFDRTCSIQMKRTGNYRRHMLSDWKIPTRQKAVFHCLWQSFDLSNFKPYAKCETLIEALGRCSPLDFRLSRRQRSIALSNIRVSLQLLSRFPRTQATKRNGLRASTSVWAVGRLVFRSCKPWVTLRYP